MLRHANHLIEIGPGSGADGGRVIAQGSVADVEANPASRIGPFLAGTAKVRVRTPVAPEHLFDEGAIALETDAIHTVHPLEARIPKGRLTCVTGVSGSGKTTLVLESLVAGLKASLAGTTLPGHVLSVDAPGIARVDLVDATPIGVNVRSTVGTYSGVLDDLRRAFAALPDAKEQGLKAGRVLLQHRDLCAAPPATARGRSPWTCSSSPTWTSPAPTAAAAATGGRPTPSKWPSKATSNCPPTPKWSATRPMKQRQLRT